MEYVSFRIYIKNEIGILWNPIPIVVILCSGPNIFGKNTALKDAEQHFKRNLPLLR